jgi:hypothetical protein
MHYSKLGYWGAQAGAIVLMALAAIVVLWLLPPQMVLLKLAVLAAVLVVAVAIALSAYRSADEVILQTHKTAWFWGGITGMVIAGVLAIAVFAQAIPIPNLMPYPLRRPEDYFADGMLAVLLIEAAGFVVFWAYHNLGRRG